MRESIVAIVARIVASMPEHVRVAIIADVESDREVE